MFGSNQVVFDLDLKVPVVVGDPWDAAGARKRLTDFIKEYKMLAEKSTDTHHWLTAYVIFCPETVEEATLLLERNLIAVAPCGPDHCWKCQNWLSNHNKDGSCWERSAG